MTPDTEVVVVGAGPYGITAGIQLRRAGISTTVFGEPMSFWRAMPRGMFLRSNWSATNIVQPTGELSLDAFVAETGRRIETPVPLDDFVRYGEWVQERALPDVQRRVVAGVSREQHAFAVTLADGDTVTAERVVVAGGVDPFAWTPPVFRSLPASLASHTNAHRDLSVFAGKDVAVVGGGQSALESAALLAAEDARVDVYVRRPSVVWLRGHGVKKRLKALGPVVYAPTDVGPLWYSRLVAVPELFCTLPHMLQDRIARRCIRPAGSDWVRRRLDRVPLHLGTAIASAAASGDRVELTLADGSTRVVDHILLGTGYRVDLARYGFLSDELVSSVATAGGYPKLGNGFESSVRGLHFVGAPAAWSFGPIMRFVSGTWFTGRRLAASFGSTARHRTRDARDFRTATGDGGSA
jgi:FAD-dependent urate hydroxylase